MFQAYYKVFYSLLMEGILQLLKIHCLIAHGYQMLPLATSQLVGDNRELMFQAYFEVFYSLLVEEKLMTIKIHQWVPMVINCCP